MTVNSNPLTKNTPTQTHAPPPALPGHETLCKTSYDRKPEMIYGHLFGGMGVDLFFECVQTLSFHHHSFNGGQLLVTRSSIKISNQLLNYIMIRNSYHFPRSTPVVFRGSKFFFLVYNWCVNTLIEEHLSRCSLFMSRKSILLFVRIWVDAPPLSLADLKTVLFYNIQRLLAVIYDDLGSHWSEI